LLRDRSERVFVSPMTTDELASCWLRASSGFSGSFEKGPPNQGGQIKSNGLAGEVVAFACGPRAPDRINPELFTDPSRKVRSLLGERALSAPWRLDRPDENGIGLDMRKTHLCDTGKARGENEGKLSLISFLGIEPKNGITLKLPRDR